MHYQIYYYMMILLVVNKYMIYLNKQYCDNHKYKKYLIYKIVLKICKKLLIKQYKTILILNKKYKLLMKENSKQYVKLEN